MSAEQITEIRRLSEIFREIRAFGYGLDNTQFLSRRSQHLLGLCNEAENRLEAIGGLEPSDV